MRSTSPGEWVLESAVMHDVHGTSGSWVDVTVLLPCHNEEEALPKVVGDIRTALNGQPYSYETLLIDDGSTDHSLSVAEGLGCRVISHPNRRGAGASRKTGVRAARGSVVIMLDADGTYTAMDIPRMLKHFPEVDQVNGARIAEQGTLPWLRIPTKWLLRVLASLLIFRNIPDLNTGLKAFKRDIMLRYLWAVPNGFSCVSSMTLVFLCNGHSVRYVPAQYHKRIGVSKFNPIKDTFVSLVNVLRVIAYFYPLRVGTFLAGTLVIIGLVVQISFSFF
jgi:polyisoprenyl-phosphate glycosyltransferase